MDEWDKKLFFDIKDLNMLILNWDSSKLKYLDILISNWGNTLDLQVNESELQIKFSNNSKKKLYLVSLILSKDVNLNLNSNLKTTHNYIREKNNGKINPKIEFKIELYKNKYGQYLIVTNDWISLGTLTNWEKGGNTTLLDNNSKLLYQKFDNYTENTDIKIFDTTKIRNITKK